MYDLIIKNGTILDGTGRPGFSGDVAVKDGKIVAVGTDLSGAEQTIRADGLTVTPGFIDSHSHSDRGILLYPEQIEKVEQGITTAVAGQCGESEIPLHRDAKERQIGTLGTNVELYRLPSTFLNTLNTLSLGTNTAILIGHSALRGAIMGNENRAPTEEELNRMKDLLRNGMEHGALGISYGLIYTPGCYAKTDELIALARVVAEYGGIADSHIRGEGDTLIEATAEFIEILRQSGIRGVLSHHKAVGPENKGKVNVTLKMLEDAVAEGIDVYCDVYPYTASHTSLVTRFVPSDLRARTRDQLVELLSDPESRAEIIRRNKEIIKRPLDYVFVTYCPANPAYEGMRLTEIAALRGQDPHETALDLVRDGKGSGNACYFQMDEEDVKTVLAYPRAMIGTDSGVARDSTHYHPRLRGTFPRVLGRYVREAKVTTLPEMIRKMTSLPARVYGFSTKGRIAEGMDADLCIFDPEKILDRADFQNCTLRAEGLHYVIVGGRIAAKDATATGICNGRLMKRT